MPFTRSRIPQLAVSAKFLCLLMVAICGAAPGMVHSVRLHNDCSSSELQVSPRGDVFSSDSHSFNEMRLESVGFGKLTIYAVRAKRFVCFNKQWKLVGAKKMHGKRCQWQEVMEKGSMEKGSLEMGFNRYHSLANPNYLLAINDHGRPMKGPRTVIGSSRRANKCSLFLKQGRDLVADIEAHNKGDHPFQPPPPPSSRHRPPAAPS